MIRSSTSCEVALEANENVFPESEIENFAVPESSVVSLILSIVALVTFIPPLETKGDGGKSENESNITQAETKNTILKDLVEIDKNLDERANPDELLPTRADLNRKLYEINQMDLKDVAQKAKIIWAIEGDENSKFFHGVINKRRSHLAIRGVFASGDRFTDPSTVKEAFRDHFGIAPLAIIDRHLPFEYTITSRSTGVEVPIPSAPAADSEANVLQNGM
nr:RNA-directed DNA polymerase, eukaryota [Tanacetum cinerariifolium]